MVDAAELLAALRARSGTSGRERRHAIACYLSASDGWRDACRALGGAFAPAEPSGPDPDGKPGKGLSGAKDA